MVSFLFAVFLVLGIFYWVKNGKKSKRKKNLRKYTAKEPKLGHALWHKMLWRGKCCGNLLKKIPCSRTVAGWEPKLSILTAMSCLTNNWRI